MYEKKKNGGPSSVKKRELVLRPVFDCAPRAC
jgi:hypothetical protein